MAFTQKSTKQPENPEKPHPPSTQRPAKDWPTRDGEPYGDPLPEGADPETYVPPSQDATPQNVTKDDPRKNMSPDALNETEQLMHNKAKDEDRSDIDPRDPNHPAKHGNE